MAFMNRKVREREECLCFKRSILKRKLYIAITRGHWLGVSRGGVVLKGYSKKVLLFVGSALHSCGGGLEVTQILE